uniref:Si:ch211-208g24.8 n=1 Tax=Cyprinus carpio TaxID=7962 RepID=A0A8C2CJK7_CYPCA
MGLEEGFKQGCPLEDIIKAINGHVKQGHEFKPEKPLSSDDPDYIEKPAPSDQAFCLVNVLAADRIQLTDGSVMEKLRNIRCEVKKLRLPQVIVMTNVDQACPVVKANLQKVYYSKKIKEKMVWCSNELGVPMCHVFPVKNYHEEIDTNDDMDVLILQALTQIIQLANDNVKICLAK